MADGHFPTLVSKDRDANAVANPIFISVSDGTDTLLIDASGNVGAIINNGAGASAVNIQDGGNSITVDGSVSITGSVTVTAIDLDIRDLTHVSDSVKVGDGTDFLAVNADGSINVTVNNASIAVTATDLDIRNLSASQDNVAISDGTDTLAVNADGSINAIVTATNLDIRDLNSATDSVAITDGGGSITVDGSVTVSASDLDIRDLSHTQDSVKVGDGTDLLAVNADGSINVVVSGSAGAKVHDHKVASAVASDTTDNHDYTAAGGVLRIDSVSFASSGGSKAVLIYDPTGTNKIIWTGFVPKEGGEVTRHFDQPFEVADTKVIRLAVTNRQGAAQDLYSLIEGEQL